MYKCFYPFLVVLVFTKYTAAQEVPPPIEQQIENKAAATAETFNKDDGNYYQDLLYYHDHPININTADEEELQQLHLLTIVQIMNLIRYRNLIGKLTDLHELQAIPGFDVFTIKAILPYVYAGEPASMQEQLKALFHNGRHSVGVQVTRVMERSKGYDTTAGNHYLGPPEHVMFKYSYRESTALQYGIVADKDAGEQWFRGAQSQGFDFYSAHFFMRRKGLVKTLALGDYGVNLGEGLIEWQSFALNKSADLTTLKKQDAVLSPHTGAGEFSFNRGAAVTLAWKRFQSSFFSSFRKYSSAAGTADSLNFFPGFNTSGYHRTPSEIAGRDKIADLSLGSSTSYTAGDTKLAVNFLFQRLSEALQKQNLPYNYFLPQGSRFFNAGFHFSSVIRNLYTFGELAADKELHTAMIAGMLVPLHPKLDAGVLFRRFAIRYQALFGNAFGESYRPQNETGTFFTLNLKPKPGLLLSAYADIFRFPWLKYRVNTPTHGFDYLMQLKYAFSALTETTMSYQIKNKPINTEASPAVLNTPADEVKKQLRFALAHQASRSWRWTGKMDMIWYSHTDSLPEKGFLGSMEGSYSHKSFNIRLRLQYFETDGYNSRAYALESVQMSGFTTSAYFGNGLSFFFSSKCKLQKNLTAEYIFTANRYYGKTPIGSGLDAINGNKKTMMSFTLSKVL